MHAHSLNMKVSGGRRRWRHDPTRAGGGAVVAALIALLFTGIDEPQSALVMAPPQLIFAAQAGTTSPGQIVTLTNQGTATIDVASLMLSNPASFDVATTDCPNGQVQPGEQCVISIEFHPPAVGDFVAELRQSERGPRVDLSGTGEPVQVAVTPEPAVPEEPVAPPSDPPPAEAPSAQPEPPPSVPVEPPARPPVVGARFALASYDVAALAGDTAAVDVVLTNTGEAAIGSVQFRFDGLPPAFSLEPGGCVLGEPGASCSTRVSFTTPMEGRHSAALLAETNGGRLASTTITGVATPKAPHAVLSRERLEFTKTGERLTLVLQNLGSAPLRVDGVDVDNTDAFDVQAGACLDLGQVEPQGACAMFVEFTGRARSTGRLTVRHNEPPQSSLVELAALTAPQLLPVPRLIGRERDEALGTITTGRFTVGSIAEVPRCDSLGEVVEQKPERGTQALEGSPIDIWIASVGPTPATVPDVREQAQREAERRILADGLRVRVGGNEETDSVASGAVARVDPRPGTRLAPGCEVTLRIAVPVPRVPVPGFVGDSLAGAKETLKSGFVGFFQPFRLGTVRTSDGSVPSGQDESWVVESQSPKEGTMVPRPSGLGDGIRIDLTVRALPRTVQ